MNVDEMFAKMLEFANVLKAKQNLKSIDAIDRAWLVVAKAADGAQKDEDRKAQAAMPKPPVVAK